MSECEVWLSSSSFVLSFVRLFVVQRTFHHPNERTKERTKERTNEGRKEQTKEGTKERRNDEGTRRNDDGSEGRKEAMHEGTKELNLESCITMQLTEASDPAIDRSSNHRRVLLWCLFRS